MVGPAAKREAVAHLRSVVQMSERRACILVSADRKMIRYRSRRPPDVELRTRLRDLANQRRRFGYRRLFILLREQGEPSGINRIYRLYREEGLTVRKRKARRKAIGTRTPILVEAKVNARWSLDFVHDQFAQGRRFRVLNIVDDVTRVCLAAIPDTSISGKRVARELTMLIGTRGKPQMIVSDNAPRRSGWHLQMALLAVQRPREFGVRTSHFSDKEECRLCTLTGENIENLVCIARHWPIVEGKYDLPVSQGQSYRAVHSSDPWVFPGINGKHTARSKRVGIIRTIFSPRQTASRGNCCDRCK